MLEATVFAPPARGQRGAIAMVFAWFSVRARWRWASAAAALVLLGVWVAVFWGRPTADPGGRSQPAPELAGLSREPEVLRELAPLVAAPPV